MLTARVATSTSTIASTLGRAKAQSETGVASMISWVRRSRSRQTSSPA